MTHKTIAASAAQTGARARFGIQLLGRLLALALSCTVLPALAQPISQSVRLPNQEYTESREDIKVKVLGGHVRINRSWVAGKWYLNPAWANLRFIADPMGGVLAIDRAASLYERTAGSEGAALYAFGTENFIAQQASGWRWYDRLGNSIDYDQQGRILAYANPSGVKVGFQYDGQGSLSGVLDHQGRQVLAIQSDGQGRVTQVSDATTSGRQVGYAWSGSGSASRLSTVTDLNGQVWRYEYDGQGQITQRTDPLGAQVQLSYMSNPTPIPDSPGFAGMGGGSGAGGSPSPTQTSTGSTKVNAPQVARVASIKDESGAVTNYRIEYDRTRRQYTLYSQEPGGLQRTQVYDKDGLVLMDSAGGLANTQRSVDSSTQERSTDARGLTTTIQYNANRQPIKTIYPDGSQESSEYDSQGRRTKATNALGIVSTWSYDAKGNEVSYTEAQGKPEQRTTLTTYDSYGQMTSRTIGAGDGKGQDAVAQRFEYDDKGNLVKVTDGAGHSSTATYNSQGLPVAQTNALGQTTSLAYDAAGNLTGSTNALNQTVSHSYDARGRRTQTTSAAGRIQKTRYDAGGRVVEVIAPGQTEGAGVRTEYDSAGRPVKATSPSGLVSTTEYDQLGRVSKATDPAGNAITYEYGAADSPLAGLLTTVNYPTYRETYQYDQRGRQTAATVHLGGGQTRVQRQGYDAEGQRISVTDPAGKSTLYQYDGLGRLTQTIDALGNVTKQTWDAQDNLLTLTDAKGNTHRFDYDKANRLTKETRPLGGAIQYSRDAAGNLTLRTDAGGNTRAYTYNSAGRMTQEVHKLGGSTTDQQVSYSHDADGQMTGYEQKDGGGSLISSASYTRDAQGRNGASSVTYGRADGSGSFSFTIGQSFNADGQLQSHTYPDGSTQSYSYTSGRLAKVTLPNGSEISYGSYSWMAPGQISVPGAVKSLSYDAMQRPTSIEVKNQAAQLLAKRLYQYDQAGNITEIESDLGKTTYGYDHLDRLTQASPDNALQITGLPQEQYSYDQVGNRTSSGHQPGAWAYNADNQMTQYPRTTPFSAAAPVDTSVSYTAQGHTKQETNAQGTKDYGYSAAERLIKYSNTPQGQSTASLEASYRYDPLGRRIAKSVKEGATTATTYFVYGDNGLMGEVNDQGQVTKAYGFNPNAAQQGLWSTDPVWQANVSNGSLTDAGTSYHYLHTDHLGTPMLATDKSGATSWKAVSEAFGAAGTLPESRITMNLRFPGQYFDSETGSHYNFHRDYKPNIGGYVQLDPIALKGGINWYWYASASPVNNFDPDGLSVRWSGSLATFGATAAFGGTFGIFNLSSECKCNKKYRIIGHISTLNLGGGVNLNTGSKLLEAAGGGSLNLEDERADCPEPYAANGSAWLSGINLAFGGNLSLLSVTRIGRLKGGGLIDFTLQGGISANATIGMGASSVFYVEKEDCDDCKK
ncbi:MAG: RHS repeat-associated core domain-containing protein [Ottowia sp.]|uniref:RHS repeat-associated core domain-containing protein n=1 Tax=Ottowia sp. TaxID=1898956 RepID=UPI0039E33B7B